MSRSSEVTYQDKVFKITNFSDDMVFIQQNLDDTDKPHYAEVCGSTNPSIVCIREYGEETTFIKTMLVEGVSQHMNIIFDELIALDS